jgi:hypothetical protein
MELVFVQLPLNISIVHAQARVLSVVSAKIHKIFFETFGWISRGYCGYRSWAREAATVLHLQSFKK